MVSVSSAPGERSHTNGLRPPLLLGTKTSAPGFREILERGVAIASSIAVYEVPDRDPSWSHLLIKSRQLLLQSPTVHKETASPTTATKDIALVTAVFKSFGSEKNSQ